MPRDIGSIIDNKYNSLSQGDKVIANTITNKESTRDIGSIINDYITKDATEIVGTSNVIPVDRNDDNSVKVTFDNIYENNKLAEVAKDFYYFRDQEKFETNTNFTLGTSKELCEDIKKNNVKLSDSFVNIKDLEN